MGTINPIIPGFSPDPSIVKVGEWYYLVNSSFHVFPGLPVYASKDLTSWRQIGNAIHRRSQLSLARSKVTIWPQSSGAPLLAAGGLYAPTIRHREGTFYIVCTNLVRLTEAEKRDKSTRGEIQNFIISTKDIWSTEWSDLVYFDFIGIDPSILFDDDGKTYIHGSGGQGPATEIKLFEIDLDTGKKLSAEVSIWAGTGGIYPEGPHIYKKNGWYYVLISEGGTLEDHMITIARSKGIRGPYEPFPHNPILTARGTEEYIQHVGHCDAFQDDNGQWWGVCLGVRKDAGGRFIMGRETFLTTATWDGGWLSFDRVKLNPVGFPPQSGSAALSAVPEVDFLYIRDPDLDKYMISSSGTSVTLTATATELSHPENSPTFIGKRQRVLSGESSVFIPQGPNSWTTGKVKAGIAVYKDEFRYVRIYYDAFSSAVVFEMINSPKNISATKRHVITISNGVGLRIQYTEQYYKVSYRAGQVESEEWISFAETDTLNLTDPDFTGPVLGVYTVAEAEGIKIEFTKLSIQ